MSRIPPEHPAAKSLEHAFRALGAEQAAERERERGRRRGRGSTRLVVLAAVTSALAVGGVATGTKLFTGDGGMLRPDVPGTKDPEGRQDFSPSDRQPAVASAPDPLGGQSWGLRTYKSEGGQTCVFPGRLMGRRLGVIRQGQFKELPAATGGLCGPVQRLHVVLGLRGYGTGRTVLYGVVDRTVRRLHLLSVAGRTNEVAIASDGTFLVVRPGRRAFRLTQLVIDGAGGRRVQALDPGR